MSDLAKLSAAATLGTWLSYGPRASGIHSKSGYVGECEYPDDAAFIVALVNAYREGRLVEKEPTEAEVARLRKYLGIFLGHDDRFQVAVGGNPIAVDAMLATAREALEGER